MSILLSRRAPLLRLFLGVALLLGALPSWAQWAGDARAGRDPFARPLPPATALLDGYATHQFDAYDGTLTLRSTGGATVVLRPWAQGVVRVETYPAGQPTRPDSSFSVVQAAAANLVGDSYSTVRTIELVLRDGFRVSVRKQPLRLTFISATGDTLLADTPLGASQRAARPMPELGLNFRISPTEHFYGTGARAIGTDRRGRRLALYNAAHYSYQNGDAQLNTTLPVVISSRGYGLFVDNHTAGYFDLGAEAKNELRYAGEELTGLAYFVIAGPSYATILDRYTRLTGRQPLPPRWALGLIQSRFGYKTEGEMYSVARRMRGAGFPLDALVLDLYWFGTTKDQGNLAWLPSAFPDPPRMMRRLDSAGVKTILISEPYVMRASKNDAFVRNNGLVGTDSVGKPFTVASFWAGPASLLDMFKPATDAWLWASYKQRLQEGAGGFWSDLGEPENHPTEIKHRLGYTRRIHNAYGMAWAQIYAKHFQREYPDRRLFNLARSGWAGMQRLSVFPWSGDIHRSWSGLQAQVPIMLGMAMSGVGYMHSDAGGFCVGPYDGELYTRWLQHSALSPIFRPHGEGVPPEPYWYPEPYQSAVREAARERYRLLPYLYALAWRNTTMGEPLARPLFWDDATGRHETVRHETRDSRQPSNDDSYLLGPNLLVAPILNPGLRRRNVALPGTGRWFDFRTGTPVGWGGQTVAVAAPLARTPLLARANAVVPTVRRILRSTAEYSPADTITLRVFADPTALGQTFTLYDDDGQSARALERGQFQTLTCTTRPLAGGRVAFLLTPGTVGLPSGAQRWLVIDVPTAPGWQVEGRGTRALGGTGPLTMPWPAKAQMLVLTNLLAAPTPKPELVPAWLGAPDGYGRFYADQATFTLPVTRVEAGETTVTLRDAHSRVVRKWVARLPAGDTRLEWNGRDERGRPLSQGIYSAELGGQVIRIVKL